MTTIVDSFNRADAGSLGTTSDGLGTWAYIDLQAGGTTARCGIVSNQAYAVGASNFGISYIDTGATDGIVQVTLAVLPAGIAFGLAFRYGSSTEYWRLNYDGSSTCGLTLRDAGGFHSVGSSFSVANNDVISVEFQGSSIVAKQNGATKASTTDSTGSANTKHGLYDSASGSPGGRFEDFSFTTVFPSTPVASSPIHATRRQSVMRAALR